MQPHFQYRWVYSVSIILIVSVSGYFIYLQSDLAALNELQRQLQFLTQHLAQPSTQKISPSKSTGSLSTLMQLIQSTGLLTQSVNIKPLQLNFLQGMEIQLTMLGGFQQWQLFSTIITQENYPVFIKNYFFKLARNGSLTLNATLFYFAHGIPIQMPQNNLSPLRMNPFCHPEPSMPLIQPSLSEQTRAITIKQMHLVGFLKANQNQYAFIQLPNNRLINATLGSVLGYEKAVITNIANDHIVFSTLAKQRIVLSLEKNNFNKV